MLTNTIRKINDIVQNIEADSNDIFTMYDMQLFFTIVL